MLNLVVSLVLSNHGDEKKESVYLTSPGHSEKALDWLQTVYFFDIKHGLTLLIKVNLCSMNGLVFIYEVTDLTLPMCLWIYI